MKTRYKITLIFICVIAGLCLLYEMMALIFPDNFELLSPVIQDIFYGYPFAIISGGYLFGHFTLRLPYTLKLWISLVTLAGLILIAQVLAIWIDINPVIWFCISFPSGIFVWNQGTEGQKFYLIKWRKK